MISVCVNTGNGATTLAWGRCHLPDSLVRWWHQEDRTIGSRLSADSDPDLGAPWHAASHTPPTTLRGTTPWPTLDTTVATACSTDCRHRSDPTVAHNVLAHHAPWPRLNERHHSVSSVRTTITPFPGSCGDPRLLRVIEAPAPGSLPHKDKVTGHLAATKFPADQV